MLHFVLEGTGGVRAGPDDPVLPVYPYCLAVVPRRSPHALESSRPIRQEFVVETLPDSDAVLDVRAGEEDVVDLTVACGLVHATYGNALALFGQLREPVVADLSHYPQARTIFETILAEQSRREVGSEALARALMSQCLVYLLRRLGPEADDPPPPWLAALDDPALASALDAMLERPEAPHTVESLASAATMSRSVFASRFHEAFGQTPLSALHEVRMQRAAQLLRGDRRVPVAEVARKVGFRSRSRFSEAFKARFELTPAVFRAASRIDDG